MSDFYELFNIYVFWSTNIKFNNSIYISDSYKPKVCTIFLNMFHIIRFFKRLQFYNIFIFFKC